MAKMNSNNLKFLLVFLVAYMVSTNFLFASDLRDQASARRQARSRAIELEKQFQLNDSIDPKVLAGKVREEFAAHADLLHQSEGRDIVAFLGNTGAGKSTLINFLAYGTERMTILDGDVVLVNPGDQEAMAIGCGGNSETIYPKAIKVGELWLYDLPGFNDTQGTVRNLINSAFIRQILTEARSVRLVIVSGEDEVTASRGETFKRMLESVQKLFKINPECAHNVFRDYSVFVLTKSTHNVLAASASHIMRKSTDEYQALLRTWTGNGRFSHMCHANTVGADWTSEQAAILSLINNSLCGDFRESDEGSRKNTVDISAIYPVNTTRVLEKMFCILMRKKFDDYLEVISNLSKLDEAIDSLKSTSRGSFWQKIDEEVSNVEEVRLLKVFCETPYADARRRFESETSRVLTTKRDRRIKELEDRCATLIETAVTRYHHEQHNETGSARIAAALNHEFHKYIYDSIFGDAILAQVTSGDGKEKEVLRKRWAGFMDEYRKKQIDAYVNCYDKAKDYATSGL